MVGDIADLFFIKEKIMSNIREFEVVISDPIKIHHKGIEVEVDTILLKAPSAKNRKEAFNMKQLFSRAIMSQQKNNSELIQAQQEQTPNNDAQDELKGKDIMMMLMSSDIDFNLFNDQFQKLLANGCGKANGEDINTTIYEKLSLEDAELILMEYLEHFLVKSLLS